MSAPQLTTTAIATAPGCGGIGVIRLPDKNLLPLTQTLSDGKTPKLCTALYTDFLGGDGQPIDNNILFYLTAPASFTGEDMVELQGHGGSVMMDMPPSHCLELGTHMAQPDEFTKHAFLNSKLDSAQAEGVADLIDAPSKSAACMTLRLFGGTFSRHIHELVDDLITLRILIEATLGLPKEDIDFLEAIDARGRLQTLQGRLKTVLAGVEQDAILREDMNVVLIDALNAGKFSLLNALAGDDIAIVTNIADTTHDIVREQITLNGMLAHITDAAGLREADGVVGQIGTEYSRKAVSEAGVALTLINPHEGVNAKTQAILNSLPVGLRKIEIYNEANLTGGPVAVHSGDLTQTGAGTIISLSAKTGTDLDLLKHALLQEIGWRGENESLLLAHSHRLNALHEAEAELKSTALCGDNQVELFTEHLRLAQNACNKITGELAVDSLLGAILSRFCIGK